MKKLLLLILSLLLFSGCAATNMTKLERPPKLKPPSDQAMLVIIRDTHFGGPIVFWHYLDGKMIGETQGRSYFVTDVPPGLHYVVVTSENNATAKFDFKPGKTYFIGEGVTMGIWRARTSGFYPMTREAAEEAMKECDYLQFNPAASGEDIDSELYQQAIKDYEDDVKNNPDSYKEVLQYDGV